MRYTEKRLKCINKTQLSQYKKFCSVHNFMNFFSACSQVMFAIDIHFNADKYIL